MNLILNIN